MLSDSLKFQDEVFEGKEGGEWEGEEGDTVNDEEKMLQKRVLEIPQIPLFFYYRVLAILGAIELKISLHIPILGAQHLV